ncbi:MAG: maleylacetate reductase [Burkholderiales bacterium]
MQSFVYSAVPARVLLGAGLRSRLPQEMDALGLRRALLVTTRSQRDRARELARRLETRCADVFDRVVMHVPAEAAADVCAAARAVDADCAIALGGGSAIGMAKVVAARLDVPVIALPTTYAGSEMTTHYGVTTDGMKKVERTPKVLPRVVIYDPELSVSLPAAVSGPSGMNGLAHCVEALYAEDANPVTSLMAEEGIGAFGRALPRIAADPGDLGARGEAFYGAMLSGIALTSAGICLHHKLCHTLGGTFNLPHAEVHAVVLSHVVAYNTEAAPLAIARVARALGVADAARGLQDLARRVGAPTSLKEIGMPHADLDRAARLASQSPYFNPAPVSYAGIRALLDDAYEGRPTRASSDRFHAAAH